MQYHGFPDQPALIEVKLENFVLRSNHNAYRFPTRLNNAAGMPRTVGFELEFTGLTLESAAAALETALGAKVTMSTAAEQRMDVEELGSFSVEIDWNYLKKLAKDHGDYQHEISLLSETASLLVPVEVVCPPLEIANLERLDCLVEALRDAGARGTDNSFFAAYGVHVNAEIPALSARDIDAYLKSYCLLQWWLVKALNVNLTRRMTPYIDLYPARYLRHAIAAREPAVEQLIDDYLDYNPTRNRALDMLPLFAEIDAGRVHRVVDDPRIKARPTFHFRLPNCLIDTGGWSLAESWNAWWVVEELANNPGELSRLCDQFLMHWRPAFGVDEADWVKRIEGWLEQSGLV